MPADGVFHLEGHGFGGGVGLSQWGAEGGAESGADAATILARYYPTASLTSVAPTTIRVLLSGLASGGAVFLNAAGLTVTGADGTATAPPADAAHTRLRLVVTGNALQLQNSSDGSSWAGEASVAAPATVGDSAGQLGVGQSDGSIKTYRGRLTLGISGASARAVDVVPLEDYLRGVVPRETPASWLPAALQAQAVAARSYAAYQVGRASAGSGYDICDTSACQVYGGVGAETPSTDAAVAATAGEELTVAGAPIDAQYGASDGGFSVDGGLPYLPAAPDPWDGVDAGNTNHSWPAAVTAAEVQARYPAVGTLTGLDVTGRDGNGDWGGRVLSVVLTGHDAAGSPTTVQTTGAGLVNAHAWPAAGDGLRSSWWHVVGQAAPTPPTTIGVASVAPFRVVETSRLGTTARRVVVTGRHGVPVGASAVFVVASAGRLSKGRRADLLAWPSGGNRSGAVAIARLSGIAPASGSGIVRLGADGALDIASTTSTVGLELTVVGWAGTAAQPGVSTVAGVPTVLRTTLGRGSRRVSMPPPVGATAALVSVTASATGRTGTLTVAGIPTQTLGPTPQTTTLVVPATTTIGVSQSAHVRVQLLGWLTARGVRLTTLRTVSRPAVTAGSRGSIVAVTGGAVPNSATTVIALISETSPVAGDLDSYPHGSSTGQLTATPPGRAATTLIATTLKDGLVIVKPPSGGTKVQLTILGWAG